MAQKKAAGKKSSRKAARATGEELQRYQKAVETFEKGLKALHKGDLERARAHFESVLSGGSDDRELEDRARTYIAICDRAGKGSNSPSPRGLEELVAQGVFWLNAGEYERAVKLLQKAVDMEPKNDHARYCLAAAYARSGDIEHAAEHLKQAVGADPYNRVLATMDNDFDTLRQRGELASLLRSESGAAS